MPTDILDLVDASASYPDPVDQARQKCRTATRILLALCGPLSDEEKRAFMWAALGGPHGGLTMASTDVLHAAELAFARMRDAVERAERAEAKVRELEGAALSSLP